MRNEPRAGPAAPGAPRRQKPFFDADQFRNAISQRKAWLGGAGAARPRPAPRPPARVGPAAAARPPGGVGAEGAGGFGGRRAAGILGGAARRIGMRARRLVAASRVKCFGAAGILPACAAAARGRAAAGARL